MFINFFSSYFLLLTSVTISLPWTLILVLLSGVFYICMSLFGPTEISSSFEAAFQSAIKLTNMGVGVDDNDDDSEGAGNHFHRRMTFMWYIVLYSLTLIILLLVFNFEEEVTIFNLIKLENNNDILLANYMNGLYLNLFIGLTLCIGAASFIMDYIYSCFNCGVFVFNKRFYQIYHNHETCYIAY